MFWEKYRTVTRPVQTTGRVRGIAVMFSINRRSAEKCPVKCTRRVWRSRRATCYDERCVAAVVIFSRYGLWRYQVSYCHSPALRDGCSSNRRYQFLGCWPGFGTFCGALAGLWQAVSIKSYSVSYTTRRNDCRDRMLRNLTSHHEALGYWSDFVTSCSGLS